MGLPTYAYTYDEYNTRSNQQAQEQRLQRLETQQRQQNRALNDNRSIYVDPLAGAQSNLADLSYSLGTLIKRKNKNKKLKIYIKSCNDPLLSALEPEDALEIIMKKGIKCSGEPNKVSKNWKKR